MMAGRHPRRDEGYAPIGTTTHPALHRLRTAWAYARETSPAVEAINSACPGLRAVPVCEGTWVLQGPTPTGGSVHACITIFDQLTVIRVEDGKPYEHHLINLPDPLRTARPAVA
ncbi:hypothetical protein [Gemmobacter nanjingensis]|nr:hypothetical protein [Gemmobacter nanjingensis]